MKQKFQLPDASPWFRCAKCSLCLAVISAGAFCVERKTKEKKNSPIQSNLYDDFHRAPFPGYFSPGVYKTFPSRNVTINKSLATLGKVAWESEREPGWQTSIKATQPTSDRWQSRWVRLCINRQRLKQNITICLHNLGTEQPWRRQLFLSSDAQSSWDKISI